MSLHFFVSLTYCYKQPSIHYSFIYIYIYIYIYPYIISYMSLQFFVT